jgi:hypothetical protein
LCFALAGEPLSFACPKESNQRKYTPEPQPAKRRPVPSSVMIVGVAEKLASKQRSLKQFQRKTPHRSRPPRLRQWGLIARKRAVHNFVASQLVAYANLIWHFVVSST